MKKQKILAAALAAVLVIMLIPFGIFAADSFELSKLEPKYVGPKDTPLLVILVNYRPENGKETLIRTTDDTYWSEMFFGDGEKGLKAFYETQSGGNFRFTPAQENYADPNHKNVVNDGVIEVSINMAHPAGNSTGTTSSADAQAIINAAMEFVDFASFDKDGNKTLDSSELAMAFVCAGYEYTRAGTSYAPSFNAYYKSGSYSAGSITVAGGFVKAGEMMNDSAKLTVGSFCHELTHYLGAPDLYTNKSWGQANSPAGKVSVMAGNGSAGKNAGESTGTSPSNIDAYNLTSIGLYSYDFVCDGEYTLYSRQSTKGTFNILKIATPNPAEYYLIENRYFDSSSSHFDSDTNYDGTRGIIIWHIDDNYAPSGNNGAQIGVAALAPRTSDKLVFPANSGVFGKAGLVFDCHDYDFPFPGYWYTSLTEEQAANYNLKIEILDDAGHEMRIRVTGAYEEATPTYTGSATVTETTALYNGTITSLSGQTLTGMHVLLSENEDMSNAKTIDIVPAADGTFSWTADNLKPGTRYNVQTVFVTTRGEMTQKTNVTTKALKVEDTENYTISFFRGLKDSDRAFNQKVKIGEPVVITFPMNKPGYVFAGWYTDAEFTEYYDISKGKDTPGDITLYGRWVLPTEAAQLVVNGATLVNETVNPAGYGVVGETFHEPVIVPREGDTFVGWFADEAGTIPFDFDKTIDSTDAVTVYAKWESDSSNPSVTPGGTEPQGTEPQGTDPVDSAPKSNTPVIVIVVIAVVVIAAVVVVVIVLKKKKK